MSSKPLPPSRTAPQFVIRFPDEGMRDRIAEAAKKNGRSMNAEIVSRLEESLDLDEIDLAERMEALEQTVEKQTNLLWEALQKTQAKKKG